MIIGLPTTGRSWNWGRKRVLPDGVEYHGSVQYCKDKMGYKPKAKVRVPRGVLKKIWGALGMARGAGDDEGHAGDDGGRTGDDEGRIVRQVV